MRSIIEANKLTMLMLAVLVNRLGSEVTVTQADIDRVAFGVLHEDLIDDGIRLRLEHRRTT